MIAIHPILEGRNQQHVLPDHRRSMISHRWVRSGGNDVSIQAAGNNVPQRSLAFYDAVSKVMAREIHP